MGEQVTVYRDRFGVPHVYGESLRAMAYGLGYAQSCDHLEPMLRGLLWAAGRLAEVDGEGALGADKEARHFEIASTVERKYGELSRDVHDLCEGFTAGLNRYMRDNPDAAPAWAEPVDPKAVVILAKRYVHYFELGIPGPILKRFQEGKFELGTERDSTKIGLIHEEEKLNSNMWAIMPEKSEEGVAVFSGDPHTPWSWPFMLYEAHLNAPGLNVAGGFMFGGPLPSIGFSDSVAWSVTANDAKVGSFFLEEPHRENPDLYKYDGEWRELTRRKEIIRVKDGDRLVDREFEFLYTHRGPAFRNQDGQLCSVQVPGYHLVDLLGESLAKCRARNVAQFREALAMLENTILNSLSADRDGNILYVNIGRLARRSDKYDWKNAVPGWTSETEWGEPHPLDDLAQLENPESGFMQNCNVQAWTVTTDCPIREEDYPDYLYFKGDVGIRPRGERIKQVLGSKSKVTIEEMKRLVYDPYVLQAEVLKPAINKATQRMMADGSSNANKELVRKVNDRIQRWDNMASVDSTGATAFHTWVWKFEELCPDLVNAREWDPADEEMDKVVETLQETGELLERVHGTLDVPYGKVHLLVRGDLKLPVGGGFRTVRSAILAPEKPGEDGIVECNFGQGYIIVVAFTDPVQAYTCLPYGVSEHPDSPHFADQAQLRARDELKRLRIDKAGVVEEAESETVLETD